MKRNNENMLKKAEYMPGPKSIRNKSLRNLLVLNNIALIPNKDVIIKFDDILNNPRNCVVAIMNALRVSERTAYDYYNTLLYLHYYPEAVLDCCQKEAQKKISALLNNIPASGSDSEKGTG